MPLSQLGDDELRSIFQFLLASPAVPAAARLVCHRWYRLLDDDLFWDALVRYTYPAIGRVVTLDCFSQETERLPLVQAVHSSEVFSAKQVFFGLATSSQDSAFRAHLAASRRWLGLAWAMHLTVALLATYSTAVHDTCSDAPFPTSLRTIALAAWLGGSLVGFMHITRALWRQGGWRSRFACGASLACMLVSSACVVAARWSQSPPEETSQTSDTVFNSSLLAACSVPVQLASLAISVATYGHSAANGCLCCCVAFAVRSAWMLLWTASFLLLTAAYFLSPSPLAWFEGAHLTLAAVNLLSVNAEVLPVWSFSFLWAGLHVLVATAAVGGTRYALTDCDDSIVTSGFALCTALCGLRWVALQIKEMRLRRTTWLILTTGSS